MCKLQIEISPSSGGVRRNPSGFGHFGRGTCLRFFYFEKYFLSRRNLGSKTCSFLLIRRRMVVRVPRSGSQFQNRRKFYPKSWTKTFFQLYLKSFLNRSWTLYGCFCGRKQSRNVIFRSIFVTPRAGLVGPRRGISPNSHKRSIWRRKSDQKSWKTKVEK